jgi:hypothetical protein
MATSEDKRRFHPAPNKDTTTESLQAAAVHCHGTQITLCTEQHHHYTKQSLTDIDRDI